MFEMEKKYINHGAIKNLRKEAFFSKLSASVCFEEVWLMNNIDSHCTLGRPTNGACS